MNAHTSTKHAADFCELQALGCCNREEYTLTFLWDRSRLESLSTCVLCDRKGFLPLGPQPAIDFVRQR